MTTATLSRRLLSFVLTAMTGAALIFSESALADPNTSVDYAFNVNGTGNNLLWSLNTPNWNPAAPVGGPDAVGIYVTLTNSISTGRNIALFNTGNAGDATKTVGRLDIGDTDATPNSFTISAGTASGILDFNGNGGTALLNQVSGSAANTISAPITLSTGLKIGNASANTLTLSGVITGGNAIEINSTGTGGVILSNGATSTFSGGVTLTAGALLLQNSSTPNTVGSTVTGGPIGTGTLTLNGGTLTSSSSNRTIANAITLGGSVTTSDYSIETARTLTLNGAVSLTNSLTLTSAGVVTFGGVITPTTGSKTLTLSSAGTNNGTISGAILTPTTSGTLDLIKTGTGRWDLSDATGATNFTGGVLIKQGTLGITADLNTGLAKSSAGSGTITIGDSGGSVDATLAALSVGSKTIANAIVAATGSTGNTLVIQNDNTGDTTFTGGITMNHDLTLKPTSSGDIIISTGGINTNGFKLTNTATGANGATTINSVISGTNGSLEQNSSVVGTNLLTLTANNTYTGATTITAGTLQIGGGATTGSLSTSSTITNNGNLTFSRSDTITQGTDFSGSAITGSGSLTQAGGGILVLNAPNSYSGVTTISSGTLQISAANNIGDGSATNTISLKGTLESTSGSYDLGANRTITMTGITTLQADAGTLTLSANFNNNTNLLTVTGAGSVVMNGVLGNSSGGLTVNAGNLTLSNANTFSGVTNLTAGATLRLTNINALQNSNFKISNSTLQLVSDTSTTFNQSGAWVNTSGTIDVSGTVAGRTIGLSGAWTQPAGASLTVTNSSNNGDILALGSDTANGATARIIANGAVTVGGLTTAAATGTTTFTLQGTSTGTVTGAITDGTTATLAVTKNESGTWTFSTANSYSGATNITAGTLVLSGTGSINNSAVTINGTTAVLRNNSSTNYTGTLTFTSGTVGGTNLNGSLGGLTISTGRTISPGNSPGNAGTTDQTWAGGGNYLFEINNATGTAGVDPGWDLLTGTGTLTISANSGSKYNILLTSLTLANVSGNAVNFSSGTSYNFLIADFANAVTGFSASAFNVNTSAFTNAASGTFAVALGDTISGGDNTQIYLTYTAIPEPSTWALLATGLTVVVTLRRRRK